MPRVRFPGPDDFEGGYQAAHAPVQNGLQSTYDGTIVVTMLDRDLLSGLLPLGVQLARHGLATTQHPIVHLVGEQREPSQVVNGVPHRLPTDGYREMILLIPFVVGEAAPSWHNYGVRMFLSDLGPALGGNVAYGYQKELARLDYVRPPDRFAHEIRSMMGSMLFRGEVTLAQPWRNPRDGASLPPRWFDLQAILQMPVLGVVAWTSICSHWELDFEEAEISAAASTHEFVRRFRDDMGGWEGIGYLDNASDGAVSVRDVRWRLGIPFRCDVELLKESARSNSGATG